MQAGFTIAAVLLAVLAASAVGDEPLPKPLAVGTRLSHSLCETYVNGPYAGNPRSLICDLAGRPAVLIYTSELDPALIKLLARLDAVAQRGAERKMTSSCVLLTTKEADQE